MYKKITNYLLREHKDIVLWANYKLGNYDDVIWLIGDGRSGTTWVSNLINYEKKYREMFEPFHPELVDSCRFLLPHQYVRPTESNISLERFASSVFSGNFYHERVDVDNHVFSYRGLLIKDIFANLLAYWVSRQFPNVKIVLLLRNPFSVALSKFKKKDWFWVDDPMVLFNQVALREDYLAEFEDLAYRVVEEGDYIVKQVLIWSVINYVPLSQFSSDDIRVVFYEDIQQNPNEVIGELMSGPARGKNSQYSIDSKVINRPSRVCGSESNLLDGSSPITSWKKELTSRQIDLGFEVLGRFGFGGLYDDSSMPNKSVLDRSFGKNFG